MYPIDPVDTAPDSREADPVEEYSSGTSWAAIVSVLLIAVLVAVAILVLS
jgi:hypothetical protein